MALSNITWEGYGFTLFFELGEQMSSPTPIFIDNHGTIEYAMNFGFHAQSKHIDIWHHFIWDNIASCKVSVHHCASQENIANILMKPLTKNKHKNLANKLSMTWVWGGVEVQSQSPNTKYVHQTPST